MPVPRRQVTPLPHDSRAERVVLSGLLREPGPNAAVFGLLAVGDFYQYPHRVVFAAASVLRSVSPADVYLELRARGQLAELGARPGLWLADVYGADPTGAWCGWAAARVKELAVRRETILEARAVIRAAMAAA